MQQQQPSPSFRSFQSKNPFTNEIITEVPFLSDDEVNKKIELSWEAFQTYRFTDLNSRCEKLLKLASILDENTEKLAKIITQEMGKPITFAIGEVKKSAAHCRFYAQNAEKIVKSEVVATEAKRSQVEYHPMGPLFHIIPFNFPFWLAFKGGIPALLIGNTILHRTADSTPQVGKAIEEVFNQAGFDKGEFQTIYSSPQQTELILSHKRIQGVSFTGSTRSGRIIASIAGKYGKKAVMELGGSDPFIVLDDADIEIAVNLAMTSRLSNSGQVCFAGKRFIIDGNIYDQFKERLLQKLPDYKVGDPMSSDTKMGPLARLDLLENIDKQVQEGVKQGAKLIYGGKKSEDPELQQGNFYLPTVCEVENGNLLLTEETFGPVFAIVKVNGEEEAVKLANDTEYGLGCVIVSKDTDRAEKLGKRIDSGFVSINAPVASDSRLPSGGVKASGFGRECGEFGAHEFANIKTVVIN